MPAQNQNFNDLNEFDQFNELLEKIESFTFLKFENPSSGSKVSKHNTQPPLNSSKNFLWQVLFYFGRLYKIKSEITAHLKLKFKSIFCKKNDFS